MKKIVFILIFTGLIISSQAQYQVNTGVRHENEEPEGEPVL